MAPFTYERVKEFTGKVQFRVDGPSVATLSGRTVKRGEVLAFDKESFVNAIVQTGNYAHVPADTPLGVPGASQPPNDAPRVAATDLTKRIREFRAGHAALPGDVSRRLLELTDAAEASDQIGPNAEPLIAAMTAMRRTEIADEFAKIQESHPKPMTETEE